MFTFNKLKIKTNSEVYDPAEDTFLLIESIKITRNQKVLEIGTGCGLISLECARNGANVICTDINPHAIKLVNENIKLNEEKIKGTIEVRKGSLFEVIKNDEVFDAIIFNPPYLPTSKEEKIGDWLDISVNGGTDGLKVTKEFIKHAGNYLLLESKAYFIYSSLSDRNDLEDFIKANNLSFKVISSKKFDFETIYVYCLKNRG